MKRMKFGLLKHPLALEICVRVALFAVVIFLWSSKPYQRVIHKEELWMYSNPHQANNVMPSHVALPIAVLLPLTFILVQLCLFRDAYDATQALLGLSLACLINGVLVEFLKVIVGRPRPDFFFRCFPDGQASSNLWCTGDPQVVDEGRKSFPSGHTAWFFCCFGYLSLYMCGKLQCFVQEGRGKSWRLCVAMVPLMAATGVGVSRIHDNMHHWDDVVVGGMIGAIIAAVCYLQYYPSPLSNGCSAPYCITNSPPEKLTPKRSTPSNGAGDDIV
eukprot:Em0013g107a